LDKHLTYLQAQDTRAFDVLVIGKAPTNTFDLNVLVYSEAFPIGSSGGFGLGQVLGYTLGYKYLINADIDCFPISKNVISTLLTRVAETGKVILPASVFDSSWDMSKTNKNYIVNHYCIVPREIYEKFGVANFRFFKGGEDWELQCRLDMEKVIVREPSILVEHKSFQSNHIDTMLLPGSKYIFYSKNYILANILLSGYALRKLRFITAFKYFYVVISGFLMYFLIYHNYEDLLTPIFMDGLTFNVDARYKPRTSRIATIDLEAERARRHEIGDSPLNGVVLSINGEGIAFKHGIEVKRNRISGAIYLLKMYLKIALRGDIPTGKVGDTWVDYLIPTKEFLDEYKFFISYLILLRPMQYIDGKIYTEKMGLLKIMFNIALFALASPVVIILTGLNILYAAIAPFPIRVGDMLPPLKDVGFLLH
jgi:hypothetical protein